MKGEERSRCLCQNRCCSDETHTLIDATSHSMSFYLFVVPLTLHAHKYHISFATPLFYPYSYSSSQTTMTMFLFHTYQTPENRTKHPLESVSIHLSNPPAMGSFFSRNRKKPLADQEHVMVGKHVDQSPLINPLSLPSNPHEINGDKYEWKSASGSEINHFLAQGYSICDPQTHTHVWMKRPNSSIA